MPRSVRNSELETRSARLKLKPRGKPHYTKAGKPGLHLGYRRLADENGRWVKRAYQGEGAYRLEVIGQADDYAEADGREVLTYWQALALVSGSEAPVRRGKAYTVADAVRDYAAHQEAEGKKSWRVTKQKLERYVVPRLGETLVQDLDDSALRAWRAWAVTYSPKRGRKPRKPPVAAQGDAKAEPAAAAAGSAEHLRRRRATVNRVITAFKAALNHAYKRKRVPSRMPWEHLYKFHRVGAARVERLTADQATRLINACPPDFRRLVEAALLTGCRYGELCALRVRDFDLGSRTLLIADSKSGKPRRIPLTDEGVALFEELTAGRELDARILTKEGGLEWGASAQARRMVAACAAAKISPPLRFNGLRHTFASLLVEKGVPLMFVATVLGHADTRMVQEHYAHLAPDVVADAVRANLPAFGVKVSGKVRTLRP